MESYERTPAAEEITKVFADIQSHIKAASVALKGLSHGVYSATFKEDDAVRRGDPLFRKPIDAVRSIDKNVEDVEVEMTKRHYQEFLKEVTAIQDLYKKLTESVNSAIEKLSEPEKASLKEQAGLLRKATLAALEKVVVEPSNILAKRATDKHKYFEEAVSSIEQYKQSILYRVLRLLGLKNVDKEYSQAKSYEEITRDHLATADTVQKIVEEERRGPRP